MTEQIAKLEAHIAALRDDLEIHRAAEEALVAHVEQLSYVIVDAKRCAAVLAFPSNYNASDYQSFADAVMGNIETLSKQEPTNALTRRDLIKQAEGLRLAADFIEQKATDYDAEHGSTDPSTGHREYPGDGADYYNEMMELADDLRQRAQELTE